MVIEVMKNGNTTAEAAAQEQASSQESPIEAPPPSTSEVIAGVRMSLAASAEALIRYGVMQKWEADHLFGPIYQHLSER